ncbi:hypothetical protein A3850_011625 [Lewinella sp. 4G2]|nr:hypothetical protein A3850_011625 [Lewinella sp. 4G2]
MLVEFRIDDNVENQIFSNDDNTWIVYKCGIGKYRPSVDYDSELYLTTSTTMDGVISGVVQPNTALLLGTISGGESIFDNSLSNEFNINYFKISSRQDSIVLFNEFVRKSFAKFKFEYRLEISDEN